MTNSINTPLTLPSGVELPNRLVKAAMTERLASPGNEVTDRHLQLYRAWGQGGIGLQITGNVLVDRRNLEAPGNVAIDGPPSNEHAVMLAKWAEASKAGGGKVVMQLSHAGRQTQKMVNPQPDAPSAIAVDLPGGQFGTPRALTGDDIKRLIGKYATATKAARAAGFDGVQIHAAHGYLISQFLSPVTNRRTDQWGGSLENRARLLLGAIKTTREAVGSDFAVSIKLNSADFQKGGFTLDECVQVVSWLNDTGLDLLEISGGSYEAPQLMGFEGDAAKTELPPRQSTLDREAYFLDYTQAIRKVATMPVAVTGGFRSLKVMQQALADDELDMIGMSRPFAADPDLARGLLDGSLTQVPSIELTKRLGPGPLDLNSNIGMVKMITMQGQVGWFAEQMNCVADNRPPNPGIGVLGAMIKMVRTEMKTAKARNFQA